MAREHSQSPSIKRVLYVRTDGRWAWRLVVNGNIVATDGGQGYEDEETCRTMADRVVSGFYADASKRILRPKS
ncbi:DUF1508 domain-containing protein [Nocardioides rubriscoriae]|uniref:DUF1508 domain-containing protein n=1 Tax=Nocardioides rubriscoriae TaxID=642762 RepID=UPI0011DF1D4A|nr:DUF1508 domain-containing protein [Nocardioides rubriscoriae]